MHSSVNAKTRVKGLTALEVDEVKRQKLLDVVEFGRGAAGISNAGQRADVLTPKTNISTGGCAIVRR